MTLMTSTLSRLRARLNYLAGKPYVRNDAVQDEYMTVRRLIKLYNSDPDGFGTLIDNVLDANEEVDHVRTPETVMALAQALAQLEMFRKLREA